MSDETQPEAEPAIECFTFPEQMGAVIFATAAARDAFGYGSTRAFASWVRKHIEEFGPAYEREQRNNPVVTVEFESVELVLIYQPVELGNGARVSLIAGVLPSEQQLGERSVAAMRRQLEARGKVQQIVDRARNARRALQLVHDLDHVAEITLEVFPDEGGPLVLVSLALAQELDKSTRAVAVELRAQAEVMMRSAGAAATSPAGHRFELAAPRPGGEPVGVVLQAALVALDGEPAQPILCVVQPREQLDGQRALEQLAAKVKLRIVLQGGRQ